MYDGPLIDAHIHLWDPRVTPRTVSSAVKLLGWNRRLLTSVATRAFPADKLAFVGDPDLPLTPYLPGTWLGDTAGRPVRGFVHIQADWQTRDPMGVVAETEWLEQVCGSDLLAVIGAADLASPQLDRILDAHHAASGRFRGIRDYLAHGGANRLLAGFARSPDRTAEPAWRRGFARLGERGLTFDIWAYGPQLPRVAALVADHPDTPVVLDHLGSPIAFAGPFAGEGGSAHERGAIVDRWRRDLAAVAANEQVRVKLSGLAMTISGFGWHERPNPPSVDEVVEGWRPLVSHALEVFGPARCIAASNFPMDRVSLPWATAHAALDHLTEHLGDAERRAVFHDNAAQFYGIS